MQLQENHPQSSPLQQGQRGLDLQARMALLQMSNSYWVSQSIYAAAKLGIADLVKDQPLSCSAIAAATHTHPDTLYRVLRGLASVGIFVEQEPKVFGLTPIAAGLCSGPGSMRASVILAGEEYYRAWGDVIYSLETGKSAFDRVFGMPVFEYYERHPASGKIFDQAMKSVSSAIQPAIVQGYDFSSFRKIVDVGGGNGSLMAAILKANPDLQGVLFDQSAAIDTAVSTLEDSLRDRCELVAGDFFADVPSGADAYFLKYVLHNWDDERAIAILRNCRNAIAEGGKLLVVEQIIPPGNSPFFGKLLDLQMLVNFSGGRERTEEEYRQIFEAAGFQLDRVLSTRSNVSILEGVGI